MTEFVALIDQVEWLEMSCFNTVDLPANGRSIAVVPAAP
jgi:hypothetical protein